MNETQLKNKVLKRLREEVGGFWFKSHGGPYQRSGLPDIIGCYEGQFVGIELKSPTANLLPTKLQAETLTAIRTAGGFTLVSNDVDEVLRFVANEVW